MQGKQPEAENCSGMGISGGFAATSLTYASLRMASCHFFNLWGNVVGMKCPVLFKAKSLAGKVIVATNIPGFSLYTVLMYELLFTTEAHFHIPSICDGAQW